MCVCVCGWMGMGEGARGMGGADLSLGYLAL